ncbi:glycosyltransferase [Simiduia agarivorans]|nr:glycosyltransferase [Simiduia agarivorans]
MSSKSGASLLSQKALPDQVRAVCIMAVYAGDTPIQVNRAIVSILRQSSSACLFIIVIDGSVSDEINAVLKACDQSEASVILIQQHENRGLAHSLNLAIDWAEQFSPDFYFRMDADDEALPERFSRQLAFFKESPNVDVLGTGMIELDGNGKQIVRIPPTAGDEIVGALARRSHLYHPTVAFRGRIFRRGFRYPTAFSYVEDLRFWAELAKAGFRFANLPEALLKFTVNKDFYRRRGLQRNFAELQARLYVMRELTQYSTFNLLYALAVFAVRLMPAWLLRSAYSFDRQKGGGR